MIAAAVALVLAAETEAQPQFDVSVGGQFMHRSPAPVARSWLASGGVRINEGFDFLVELAIARDPRVFRGPKYLSIHTTAGIRGRLPQIGRFTPFYQGLVGLFTLSPSYQQNRVVEFWPWDADAPFVLQPGGGLDLAIRPGLKARFTGGLMVVVFEGSDHNAFRATVGLAAQF